MKKDISNVAMLVSLRMGRIGSSKVDKAQSDNLTDHHQMERGSARVSKVIIQNADLKKINRICNEAKALRDKFTLPWNDQGQRMLPSSCFREFDTEMNRLKNDFQVAVQELARDYPRIKADAQRRLNGMFNEDDYPEKIESKFNFELEVVPMPKGSDLRINVVSDEERERLQKEIEARTIERVKKSTNDVVGRMMSSLMTLLQGTDGQGGLLNPDARFHKTAVTKLQEIIDIAPELNVLDDPTLSKMIEDVKELIKPENLDVDKIRNDTSERNKVLSNSMQAVESIKNAMGGVA